MIIRKLKSSTTSFSSGVVLRSLLSVAATLGFLGGVRHAHAQCDPVVNGMTCMDDVTSCSLNCTANDVTLAVYNISGTCNSGGAQNGYRHMMADSQR